MFNGNIETTDCSNAFIILWNTMSILDRKIKIQTFEYSRQKILTILQNIEWHFHS